MRKEIMKENLIKNGIDTLSAIELYKLYYNENFFNLPGFFNSSLFFHGKAGTGKTLRAIAQCIYNHGQCRFNSKSFKFINFSEMLFEIRKSYNQSNDSTESDFEGKLIDKCREVNYLILDDLGAEKSTEFAMQILYLIINYRYGAMKTTIITSNFNIQELQIKMNDDRIISRISAMCSSIHCKKQYRQHKTKN